MSAGLFRLTRCENFYAFAFALCITLAVAHGATAQSRALPEPRPPMLAPDDSAMAYPCLTLNEVVARALSVSPTVASGAGGVRNARSSERVAFGAYLPSLTATADITRSYGLAGAPNAFSAAAGSGGAGSSTGLVPGTSGAGGGSVLNGENFGLAASVPLFTGGRRRANVELARASLSAARSTFVQANFTARLSAQQAFYQVIRAMDLVVVARAALAQAEQLLRFTRDMFRAGTVTRSDLLRAQLQVTTTQEQLLADSDTLLAASYALGWLAGVDGPAGARPDSTSEAMRPLALDDSIVVRLAAEVSPVVSAAEATLAANEAAVRAARTQYIPTITASAGYNWVANDAKLSHITSGRPGWTFILGTSYPVFNGFQREDAITRAEVAAQLARVTARDTRRLARSNAAQLLSTLHTATGAISLGTEAVVSAREDLRVQMSRFRAGISTMLDVLTSESALVQAENRLVQARLQYHTTRAAIEALIGRLL